MIRQEKEITELYNFKHFNDDYEKGVDYDETLLENMVSKHLYDNENNLTFMQILSKHLVLLSEEVLYIRNLKNFFVDKYYNDYNS